VRIPSHPRQRRREAGGVACKEGVVVGKEEKEKEGEAFYSEFRVSRGVMSNCGTLAPYSLCH
jgi:hypothetical protein